MVRPSCPSSQLPVWGYCSNGTTLIVRMCASASMTSRTALPTLARIHLGRLVLPHVVPECLGDPECLGNASARIQNAGLEACVDCSRVDLGDVDRVLVQLQHKTSNSVMGACLLHWRAHSRAGRFGSHSLRRSQ